MRRGTACCPALRCTQQLSSISFRHRSPPSVASFAPHCLCFGVAPQWLRIPHHRRLARADLGGYPAARSGRVSGAAALQRASVPSGSQAPMGTSPAAPGGRHGFPGAAAALLTATWLRLGCGLLPRPLGPHSHSGSSRLVQTSAVALPSYLPVALLVQTARP